MNESYRLHRVSYRKIIAVLDKQANDKPVSKQKWRPAGVVDELFVANDTCQLLLFQLFKRVCRSCCEYSKTIIRRRQIKHCQIYLKFFSASPNLAQTKSPISPVNSFPNQNFKYSEL